jgi:hypothetical protein
MSGAIPLLPLWAFVVCYRAKFTFTSSLGGWLGEYAAALGRRERDILAGNVK